MKITIVSQYFYPEEFKVNDLAEEWVKRGHEVTVLTGKPNYPGGKILKGYRFWGVQEESYKGIRVIRVPLTPRGKGGGIRLALNYLSYVFFASYYVLTHRLDTDRIFCFEISPVFQMYPALLLKRKTGADVSMWIQDLWPESVAASSNLKSGFIQNLLSVLIRDIYRRTDTLFVQSPAFYESVLNKGEFQDKLSYVPNWAEDVFTKRTSGLNKHQSLMPKGFKVMFAGNIGAAQDFESIIQATVLTRHIPEIKWVIVGDGRMRTGIEQQVKFLELGDTVSFLGRYPVEEMPDFFALADVMLVSLKNEYIFSLTIPSKMQAYMASGKPIVTMLSGIGNQILKDANCGLTAESGDYKLLAENVIAMYHMSNEERLQLGMNGQVYYNVHFQKRVCIDRLDQIMRI